MRKIYLLSLIAAFAIVLVSCDNSIVDESTTLEAVQKSENLAKKTAESCTSIQDGTLTYSTGHYLEGEPLVIGYDIFGYNYQAHMFNGSYANAYLGRYGFPPYEGDDDSYLAANPLAEGNWVWPYRKVNLSMKWNEAWLSNQDCDGDGLLDRHYGFDTYIGSGAWLTNHEEGVYIDDVENFVCDKHNYFVKIIAAPEAATKTDLVWYNEDGTEIGPDIWGAFVVTQEVLRDPCNGVKGIQYRSEDRPGLGNW